jgi:hypothetical protein
VINGNKLAFDCSYRLDQCHEIPPMIYARIQIIKFLTPTLLSSIADATEKGRRAGKEAAHRSYWNKLENWHCWCAGKFKIK